MKRIIALFVAMLLCVSLLCVTALADGDAYLSVAGVSAARGEEVTVTVNLNNNPGIAGMDLVISYDETRLEKVGYTGTGMGGGNWTIINHAIWDNVGDSTYTGAILKLTFKVKSDAPCGAAKVSVSCSAGNWDGQRVTVSSGSGSVNVTHTWGGWKVVTPATCTAEGKEERACTKCDATETNTLTATGHSWGGWKVVTPATCTAEGKEERVCSGCGATESNVLTATGHSWGGWKVVTPATCAAEGKEERVCSGCGATESNVLPMTTHTWGEWEVVTPATCTAEGKEERACSGCGATESNVLPATGHDVNVDEWCKDKDGHWHECDNDCGEVFDQAAHEMEDKTNYLGQSYQKCKICGYETVPVGEIPDDVPPTGDITILFYGGALIFMAIACAAVVIVKKRKAV